MRTAGREPREPVLQAEGRERREPAPDAADRRAVYPDAIFRKPPDGGLAAKEKKAARESQTGRAVNGGDRSGGRVPEAQIEPARRRSQDLSVLAQRRESGTRQPGLEHRYYVHPHDARLLLPGGGDGLAQPVRAQLGPVVDDGTGLLPGSVVERVAESAAGNLQQRSGLAVHQREVHRRVEDAWHHDQHGWTRA